jgi:2-succinyl-6-hydroxy-2,4-cyclohexadiene-1-carboxylate synthase
MPRLKKTPLVFLHGFLGSKQDFTESINLFSPHFPCFSFDLPGHGQVSLPEKPSYDVFLALIAERLEQNQIKKCHLIGYSMGGRLALLFAKKFPDIVDKLIIISSHLGIEDKRERKDRLLQDTAWAEKLQNQPIEQFLTEWYNQPLFNTLRSNKARFQEMLKRRSKVNPKDAAAVLQNLSLAKQKTLWKDLSHFTQNMLFICGAEDEKYKSLYDKIPIGPKVQVATIPSAGHAPHLEKPDAFAEKVLQFLEAQ